MQQMEERIAHLIRAVDDLSDVVARQSDEIAVLEHRVRMLMEHAAQTEMNPGAIPPADRRPPHW